MLLDPNTFSEDGTVSLGMVGVSDDGEHLAYGTSASGSDWVTIRVMRVRDKEHLPDTLSWVSTSSTLTRRALLLLMRVSTDCCLNCF